MKPGGFEATFQRMIRRAAERKAKEAEAAERAAVKLPPPLLSGFTPGGIPGPSPRSFMPRRLGTRWFRRK